MILELEFGLIMALIGVVSVFSSLAVIALMSMALKRTFKSNVELSQDSEQVEPSENKEVEATDSSGSIKLRINQREYQAKVEDLGKEEDSSLSDLLLQVGNEIEIGVDGEKYNAVIEETNETTSLPIKETFQAVKMTNGETNRIIKAPMHGNVVTIPVKIGDRVGKGTIVVVLETMKMESSIESATSGIVKTIRVTKGATVKTDDILMIIGEERS